MPRTAQPTDFVVKVEDIGSFTFGRRTMKDEIAIQVEFARLIDGVEPTSWLQAVCGWLSVFKVLTVRAPEGWDIETLDPLDDETYSKMNRVYEALSDQERSFRRGKNAPSEGRGSEAA